MAVHAPIFEGCTGRAEEERAARGTSAPEARSNPAPAAGKVLGGGPGPLAFYPRLAGRRSAAPVRIRPGRGPVLLLLVDALTTRHLSTYGYGRPTSPSLDRLAAEGILFTHAVSASCWTRPSVAALMTGKPAKVHLPVEWNGSLDANAVTLAEAFRAAGYATAGFVANPLVRARYGYDQGFGYFLDSDDFGLGHPAEGVIEQAIDWIARQRTRDFFVWVFLVDAHDPYRPPLGYSGIFGDDSGPHPIQPPPAVETAYPPDVQSRIEAAYDAKVRSTFDQLGRLFEALRELRLYDDATIVVSADHGEMLGEHLSYRHLYHLWEPVVRIPLVVRSPALQTRGVVEPRLFSQIDLLPTLLALSGIRPPDGIAGRSWLPVLADPAAPGDAVAISETTVFGVRRRAIRDERYKLVVYYPADPAEYRRITGKAMTRVPLVPPRAPRLALYDLWEDPHETNDLARGALPEAGRRLLEAGGGIDALPLAAEPQADARVLEELRSLGYAN